MQQTVFLTFMLPPSLVVITLWIARVVTVDDLIHLFQTAPFYLILGPFNTIVPFLFWLRFRKLKSLIESESFDQIKGQRNFTILIYSVTAVIYAATGPLIANQIDFYPMQVLLTGIMALACVFTSSIPLLMQFIVRLDLMFQSVPGRFLANNSLRSKSLVMNITSTIGGITMIVTAAYGWLWRSREFPVSSFSDADFLLRMSSIGAFVIFLVALPGIVETNRYAKYLNKLKNFARSMGSKDLTHSVSITSRDEFGEFMEDLNLLNSNFKNVIMLLQSNSVGLHQLSGDLANLAAGLSGTSAQQAANAEEIAASVEETSANIANASEHAQESAKISVTTHSSMDESYQLTNNTHHNVSQIIDKISVIQELSDQTNLLAINAFIEAANAGDSGKGFAVVAREIRALADRSKTAAEEISVLAGQSKVNSEASVVKSTEMIAYITKTSEMAKLVSESSKEQYSSIDQINQTVQDFNKTSQSLAMSSQEISASSKTLMNKAGQLDEILKEFQIEAVTNSQEK